MNCLAQRGQKTATQINESAQEWLRKPGLIINELRRKEIEISRHEICNRPSLNPNSAVKRA